MFSSILLVYAILVLVTPVASTSSTPIVLWHGLGDTYKSRGMRKMTKWIQEVFPDRFVYSVRLNAFSEFDRMASYFGNLPHQLDTVCKQLKSLPELRHEFHAVGFSQGGLFLRGLVQTCPGIKVKTLITFGSPHAGISDLPGCDPESDNPACEKMEELRNLIQRRVYSPSIQKRVVPAQYFKAYQHMTSYLENCRFLPVINNERPNQSIEQKQLHRERLLSLEKLVLVRFEKDTVLVPRNSAWFHFYNATGHLISIRNQQMYKEDWIGLNSLDQQRKLVFASLPGDHLEIPADSMKNNFIRSYLY